METLTGLLRQSAASYGSRVALSTRRGLSEEVWTYQRLWASAQSVSQDLLHKERLEPGDRVLVWAPNSPDLVGAYFGAMLARLILVPLDPSSTPDFIKRVAEKTEASAIITGGKLPDPLRYRSIDLSGLGLDGGAPAENDEPAPDDIDDIVEIVFTSGTTGDPKGVILTHRNIVANLLSAAAMMPKRGKHRFLSLLPLSHMLEQTVGLYLPLYHGATVCYPTSRQPSVVFKAIRKQRITTMVVVPQALTMMIKAIEAKMRGCGKWGLWQRAHRLAGLLPMRARRWLFSSVHRCLGGKLDLLICGGAPLGLPVAQSWERLGVKIVEGYGATECAPIVAGNTLRDRVFGSVGRPVAGVAVRLSGEGEILVQGGNVTQGYWRDRRATEAAFTVDGWYRSGDLAEIDGSGRLYLKGRLRDRIVLSSGLNVYPEDVEQALREQEAVFDSVVLGRSDEGGNTRLEAAIRPTHTGGTMEQIYRQLETAVRSANARLAPHQRITNFTIWEEPDFPRTALLKVKRHEVAAILANGKGMKPAARHPHGMENDRLGRMQGILSGLAGTDACKVRPESDLDLDLGLDSLSRVELAVCVEEQFGIDLDEQELSEVKTVGDLIGLVERGESASEAVSFPTWSLTPATRLLRSAIQRIAVFPLHSGICRPFQIEGLQNLESLRLPALFIANHSSHVDTLSILRALPGRIRRKVAVAAAADYFSRNPILRLAAPLMVNTFPLSRRGAVRASLEYCGELADAGWSILIYPEGTRSTTGGLQPFKSGIGLLATELQVRSVPIGVEGGFRILPKGRRLPRPGPVKVRFGRPIEAPRKTDSLAFVRVLENAVADLMRPDDLRVGRQRWG